MLKYIYIYSHCQEIMIFFSVPDLARFSFRATALRCNLCVSKGLGNRCTPSVQTCVPSITNCGYIKLKPGLLGEFSHHHKWKQIQNLFKSVFFFKLVTSNVLSAGPPFIRSCVSMATCWNYMYSEAVEAKCCNTDLCNWASKHLIMFSRILPFCNLSGMIVLNCTKYYSN